MHQATGVSEDEQPEPKRKSDPSAIFRKIGQHAVLGEEAARLLEAWAAKRMNRLWGILQAKTGGTLYKIIMNSDLSEEDKQFVKETKNEG